MKIGNQQRNLRNLEENLYLDEGKLRVSKAFCYGSHHSFYNEDVLLEDYQLKIKQILKDLREYSRKRMGPKEIYLSPLFSPAFYEYEIPFVSKEKHEGDIILRLTNWSYWEKSSEKSKVIVEIPYEDQTIYPLTENKIVAFARKMDKKIKDSISDKENSLIGKLRRRSFSDITPFDEIDYEVVRKNPAIETFYNRRPDCILGDIRPDIWRLD